MIAGDHPHHRRQPPREMVQCETNSKADWPHLNGITDPAALDAELARIRTEYNTTGCTPRSGTSPPTTSITAAGPQIRRARAAGMRRARVERIKQNRASKS